MTGRWRHVDCAVGQFGARHRRARLCTPRRNSPSPPTSEGNLGPISFLDPFGQNELVLRSFAAGVTYDLADDAQRSGGNLSSPTSPGPH
jgi:hypothetical protein